MKQWMRRGMAVILAAAMCFSCACTKTPETENPKSEEPKQTQAVKEQKQSSEAIISQTIAEYPSLTAMPKEEDFTNQKGEFDSIGYNEAYAAWKKEKDAKIAEGRKISPSLAAFYEKTLPVFLGGREEENTVYSPINVYLALAMLAEIVDGNSRAQLLAVMGAEKIEEVRQTAKTLWLSNYESDDALTCLLANSLWLNEDVTFHEDTLKTLAVEHFASSYAGRCGSDEMNEKLRVWLDENTGGLLHDAAQGIELTPQTVIARASTIYYKANWIDPFMEGATKEDVFHSVAGDQRVPFMVQTQSTVYQKFENMTVTALPLREGGFMYFFLPDEGVRAESLLGDEGMLQYLSTWQPKEYGRVRIHLPKFDVSSSIDLIGGLTELGVTDVFDPKKSDFTPLTQLRELMVSQITHAGRVKVDEEGVEAAAFTVIMTEGTTMLPTEPIDVVLDRPFVFAVTSADGTALFTGIVNTMN